MDMKTRKVQTMNKMHHPKLIQIDCVQKGKEEEACYKSKPQIKWK